MSRVCEAGVPWETLVAYWAADLAPPEEERLEEHLMECAACAATSARIAAITETFRGALPPLLSPEALAGLRQKGLRIRENPISPGEVSRAVMGPDLDVMVHRLEGMDLTHAARVSFEMRAEGTDHVMVSVDRAPFDRDGGAVLVACHAHYASLPHDVVAEVRTLDESGAETVTAYTIHHVFE